MIIQIKQIKENQQIIFPQTSAEAVLVKNPNKTIITLDKVLNKKVIVDEQVYTTVNQNDEVLMNLGDDFKIDSENKIQIKFNNL